MPPPALLNVERLARTCHALPPSGLTARANCLHSRVVPQGYEYFGFNRTEGGIVYREWAPAAAGASLIGDFNSWNPDTHKMARESARVQPDPRSTHLPPLLPLPGLDVAARCSD